MKIHHLISFVFAGVLVSSFSPVPLNGATIGQAAGDHYGAAVGMAGDVNGDGFDEVIIGAPDSDSIGADAGRIYVYYGSATGLSNDPPDTLDGETAGDRFGAAVSGAGDVNGDGFDDIIVGAPNHDTGGANAGRIYVYYGSAAGISPTPPSTRDGQGAGDEFGAAVDGAGDVDGDGFHDVVVGAPLLDGDTGRVYVYFGSASGLSTDPPHIRTGANLKDFLGASVAGAGDVNNDGFDDVVAGAPVALGFIGRVFVYYGSSTGLSTTSDFRDGAVDNAEFGRSVGAAGDLNNDGFADIIVGAPARIRTRIYVYFGSATGLSASVAMRESSETFDEFGWSVSGAGDYDGDGFDDVIVGAPLNGLGLDPAGTAFLYKGAVSGLSASDPSVQGGAADGDEFGRAVAGGGDINGDGFGDRVIGAPGDDTAGADAGRAYVILGTGDITPNPFSFPDQLGVDPNTLVTSNSVTVSGINAAATIEIASCGGAPCEYSINGGPWTSTSGLVQNGQGVQVRMTSSPSFNATSVLQLRIGTGLGTFSVTTKAGVNLSPVWINPGQGDWFDTANWDTGTIPTLGGSAKVLNGGTAIVEDPGAEAESLSLGTALDADGFTISGSGTLIVRGGGTLLAFPSMSVTRDPLQGIEQEATAIINGPGSRWSTGVTTQGTTFVLADNGIAKLVVGDGGVFDHGNGFIRTAVGGAGDATIAVGGAPGETPIAPGVLGVRGIFPGDAFSGAGNTTLVFNHTGDYYFTGDGTPTGIPIDILLGTKVTIEHAGPGTTTFLSGTDLDFSNASWDLHAGTMVLDGPSWTMAGFKGIDIGDDPGDDATLVIRNGSLVDLDLLRIGGVDVGEVGSSVGTLLVEGAGSLVAWGTFFSDAIGAVSSTGRLLLKEGGKVSATGRLRVGVDGASTGLVEIGLGATAGVLDIPELFGGNGDATLRFSQTDAPYYFTRDATDTGGAIPITGRMKVEQVGTGTTILTGTKTYTGATTVSAGNLQVDGTIANSTTTVHSGATLAGSGTVAAVTIDSGGVVAPGASPGTLTTGALTLNAGSILEFELDTPATVGSGVNDLIAVNGDLVLDGMLNVTSLGGFALGTYTLITYTGTLTDNGLAIGSVPNGSGFVIDTATAGEVRLIVQSPIVTLGLAPAPLDFGDVLVGATSSVGNVAVMNTGNANLILGSLSLSGTNAGDFLITSDPCSNQTVAPAATCMVELTLTPAVAGARVAQLDVPSNAASSPDAVALLGNGIEPLTVLSTANLDFGDVLVGVTSAPLTVMVENGGGADLVIGTLAISGTDAADFALTNDPCSNLTLGPAATCVVELTLTPSVTGARNAQLDVPSNAASNPDAVALNGTGVEPLVSLSTANLAFGDVRVGTASPPQTVTVENTGTADLVLGSLAVSGADVADFALTSDPCSNQTVAPAATCTVELTLTPSSAGARSAQLDVPSNAASSSDAVSMSGNGVEPLVTLTPIVLGFGDVTVGAVSPPESVTIENTGTADLTLGGLTLSGVDAADFVLTNDPCSHQTLTPGATCTVELTLSPLAGGARNAQLDVPSDAASSPDAVTLTGNGVLPGIVVDPNAGLITTEGGGTASFTVVLASQPVADVTIDLSSSDTSEGTVAPTSVTFNAGDWNVAQTITITGIDDSIDDDDVAYTIVSASAVSGDPIYDGRVVDNVAVTNQDDDTAGVIVNPTAGLTTTEAGATATFGIVLTSEPVANVTIGVSSSDPTEGTVLPNSLTFTAGNWNTPQIVTVTGSEDFVADGDAAYTIMTADAVSTDPKYDGMVVAEVAVTNLDDESPGIAVSPTAGLVTTEAGGTASFTIILASQPTADVVIDLTSSDPTEGSVSPARVTFSAATWNVAQTVTITGVDDFVDDGDIGYTIVSSTATSADAGYDGRAVADVSVHNVDDDAAGVLITPIAGLVTTEGGGTSTFTVVLATEPAADVSIHLTSSNGNEGIVAPVSLTFTAANWNVVQTATVTGVDDLVIDGDQPYMIVTGATSGDPLYDGITVSDISVTNGDDEVSGIVVTPTSGLITTEAGGTATFTIVLSSQPTADVSIVLGSSDPSEGTLAPASATFSASNWSLPQMITVTGVDDAVADGDQPFTIVTGSATSADLNFHGVAVPDVGVTNLDDDLASIEVTPTLGLTTTEAGGTATFTIVLTSEPVANVTIGFSTSDPSEGTVAPASVTFTSANWSVAQTITVTGVDDLLDDGDQPFTIVTAAAVSADGSYDGRAVSDVSVTNLDDDGAGVVVTPSNGLVTSETGAVASFTIVLQALPIADVRIGLASADVSEGSVSPASVTFTSGNWNVAQTVTVTGVDDSVADGDQPYTIVTAAAVSADGDYDGLDPSDVSVMNLDDDTAGIVVTPTTGLVTTESGGTASFTIVLGSEPLAPVIIGLGSLGASEGIVSPANVTFMSTDWNVAQTVTVTGVDDAIADGDQPYVVITTAGVSADAAYNGLDAADVTITNLDDDTAGIVVTPTTGLVTTESGGTASFMIVLLSEPVAEVVIELGVSDPSEGIVSPSSARFTSGNWNVAQTMVVEGVDDVEADGDQLYTVVTSSASSFDAAYSRMAVTDVEVTNLDDETSVEDRDGDGRPDEDESEGPNDGDANGDGEEDSQQEGVATIRAANGNGWITIVASCPLREVEALAEGESVPRNQVAELPFALVGFRMPCARADVEILFHEQSSWPPMSHYLKYGPLVPGETETTQWYALAGTVLDTVTVGGATVARARLTLADGEPGDATAVDGWIVDPGGPAIPAQRILPVVGSTAGQGGSFFRTTMQLHNPAEEPIAGRIVFLPGNGSESPELEYALEPRETLSIADLLPSIGTAGLGSADIVVSGGGVPVSVVRIFNDAGEAGTSGMSAPALTIAEALRGGEEGILIAPPDPAGARFNIGLRALEASSLVIETRNRSGVLLHTVRRSYPADWFRQTRAEELTGVGLSASDSIRIVVEEGAVIVYGATTDNRTHDPSLQIASRAPEGARRIVPVVGSLAGRGGSFFRTAVQLHNGGEEASAGEIVFHPREGGGETSLPYALEPRETLTIPDLLPAMGREGLGSAEIVATAGGLPVSVIRIFNDGGEEGTAGMNIDALAPEELLSAGETGVLLAPPDPETTRFNIGIRSVEATVVNVRVTNREGALVRTLTRMFPAGHFEQTTAEAFSGGALAADDAVAITIESGRAAIYGSTTDNRTHDPSLQLARRAR